MIITLDYVLNAFTLTLQSQPSATDPLGTKLGGTWSCVDTTDVLGRIAAAVKEWGDPIQDRFERN